MSLRPRLLFVTEQLPYPLTDGGNIRTYHILTALSNDFRITLVASGGNNTASARSESLERFCEYMCVVPRVHPPAVRNLARSLWGCGITGTPMLIRHSYNHHVAKAVNHLISERAYDFVHLNHVDTVQYLDEYHGRVFLDTHNILFDLYSKMAGTHPNAAARILSRSMIPRLEKYELASFEAVRNIFVCSEREQDILNRKDCSCNISVIPNGVDCTYFSPSWRNSSARPPTVVFFGHMGYWPNDQAALHFIRNVMPLLRKKLTNIRFVVVGKCPSAHLRRLAARTSDIEISGEVADLREHIRLAQVCVVPLLSGGGTRIKILEAFAMGIPTVTTSLGAEGIPCTDGEHVLISDTPYDMSESILRLIDDSGLASRLSRRARALVEQKYDWNLVEKSLLSVYKSHSA